MWVLVCSAERSSCRLPQKAGVTVPQGWNSSSLSEDHHICQRLAEPGDTGRDQRGVRALGREFVRAVEQRPELKRLGGARLGVVEAADGLENAGWDLHRKEEDTGPQPRRPALAALGLHPEAVRRGCRREEPMPGRRLPFLPKVHDSTER
ncbi:hypothetical protein [Streptomyces sp. NBC_00059]|uniref:hypothetical protein n=1 Tax=Streptomyces sp. NBC_00059 TaxID=2975635 RepID=UPI00224FB336|nr:hypothetical protein [Streptomyces sp. NBC_00059]MCX5417840.1 hypothetical protein [Streptomyces sp. NBC_00059]